MRGYYLGFIIALLAALVLSGFFYGRATMREKALKDAMDALMTRGNIDHDTQELNSFDLCLALGGLHHECADLMRRVD